MFAEEIRRAAEAAPRARLHEVSAALWKAFTAGGVSEAEAEAIGGLIEARQAVPPPAKPTPRRVGSRPRTGASMDRRRRWAASGRLPPQLAARFTLAETAVLAVVAAETARRGDCRLAVGHIAAIAGVSETTVRNAIREAGTLRLVEVEVRRITGFRNDTNIVRIVSSEWQAWNRLARQDGGCKFPQGTPTKVLNRERRRPAEPLHGLPEGSGRPRRSGRSGTGEAGGMVRAML